MWRLLFRDVDIVMLLTTLRWTDKVLPSGVANTLRRGVQSIPNSAVPENGTHLALLNQLMRMRIIATMSKNSAFSDAAGCALGLPRGAKGSDPQITENDCKGSNIGPTAKGNR